MSEADLRAVADVVEKAAHPEDVFGLLAGNRSEQLTGLKHQYRRLIAVVHPDHYPGDKRLLPLASAALSKATELYHLGERKINAGTYGDRTKTEPEKVDPDPPPDVVEIDKTKYTLVRRFAQGDLCDLYECTYIPPITKPKKKSADPEPKSAWAALMEPDEDLPEPGSNVVFKLVRAKQDNDLVENEARILKALYPSDQKDEKYYRYLPKLINSLTYRSRGGANRRVNLLTRYDGMFTMAEVLGTYPKGLDYRDVVWMYKRLLEGLGFVHSKGIVHGAILLPHVLVHPVNHGARILDWSYAIETADKGHIKAISKAYRTYYPPEVLAKKPATPATDIFMATKCAIAMLGGEAATGKMADAVPKPLQSFLKGCLLASPSARPDDAWVLHKELTTLLETVVGKPKYRELAMPPVAKA